MALSTSKKALDLFDQVIREAPHDSPQARVAALGKARVLEMRNELPKAIEQYELVAKEWPDSPEADEARRYAEALKDPQAAAFYKELYAYSPTKVTLPPGGTGDVPDSGSVPASPPVRLRWSAGVPAGLRDRARRRRPAADALPGLGKPFPASARSDRAQDRHSGPARSPSRRSDSGRRPQAAEPAHPGRQARAPKPADQAQGRKPRRRARRPRIHRPKSQVTKPAEKSKDLPDDVFAPKPKESN